MHHYIRRRLVCLSSKREQLQQQAIKEVRLQQLSGGRKLHQLRDSLHKRSCQTGFRFPPRFSLEFQARICRRN